MSFDINTCIRMKKKDQEQYEYTDNFLKPVSESDINVVFLHESVEKFTDNLPHAIKIRYNPSTKQYECSDATQVEESKEELKEELKEPMDFTIVDTAGFGKNVKEFKKRIAGITTPILLLDHEGGKELEYDPETFGQHFPIEDLSSDEHSRLRMSTTSLYSSAGFEDGAYTAHLLRSILGNYVKPGTPVSIFDACANVGGNTIFFAEFFDKVVACEYSKQEFERLTNNIHDVYGLNNVETVNGSCVQVLQDYHDKGKHFDVLFFDPPWGGQLFHTVGMNKLIMGLDDQDTVQLIDYYLENNFAKVIAMKHPYNTAIRSKFPYITQPYMQSDKKELYRLTIWIHSSLVDLKNQTPVQLFNREIFVGDYIQPDGSHGKVFHQLFHPLLETSFHNVVKHDNAYVVLVMKGDYYVPGAIATIHSIKRTKPQNANTVVMYTPDVSPEAVNALSFVADYVVKVDPVRVPSKKMRTEKQRELYESWIDESYTKWKILALPFKKVISLDADVIIVENIDHLFDLQTPAAPFNSPFAAPCGKLKNIYTTPQNMGADKYVKHGELISQDMVAKGIMEGPTTIHGTAVVLSPDMYTHQSLLEMLYREFPEGFGWTKTNSGFDEQSLAYFMSVSDYGPKVPWTNVHHRYNFMSWKTEKFLAKDDTPYIIHFMSQPKSWSLDVSSYEDVIVWWTMFLDAVEHRPEIEKYLAPIIKKACGETSAEDCLRELRKVDQVYLKKVYGENVKDVLYLLGWKK